MGKGHKIEDNKDQKKDELNLFDFLDTLTLVIHDANKRLNDDLKTTFSRLYTDSKGDYLKLNEIVNDIKTDVEMLKGSKKLETWVYRNIYKIAIIALIVIFGTLIISWN